MAKRHVVLIHGYSSNSNAFLRWEDILIDWGYPKDRIHVLNYVSLSDEVTIPDIGKGLEAALRIQPGLDTDEEFDAIVHSTGMLVLRSWALQFPDSSQRLRHLIALAPATFGSPLAHKGRTYLGKAVSGNRIEGPDFREAGDLILEALELASPFTWNLAHDDVLAENGLFRREREWPRTAIFCGTEGYKGLRGIVNEPGTDGTVRLAGAGLRIRKIHLDLLENRSNEKRLQVFEWSNEDLSVIPVAGTDHGTILSDPTKKLQHLVKLGLDVNADTEQAWRKEVARHSAEVFESSEEAWQQIVFKVIDDQGVPIPEYFIDFHTPVAGGWLTLGSQDDARPSVRTNGDSSYRCFHLDVSKLRRLGSAWVMTLRASSGTNYIDYAGHVEEGLLELAESLSAVAALRLDLPNDEDFFIGQTTTLVEVTLDRRPGSLPSAQLVEFPNYSELVARRAEEEKALLMAQREKDRAEAERLYGILEERARHEPGDASKVRVGSDGEEDDWAS